MRTLETTVAGARRRGVASAALATIAARTLTACADLSGITPANRLATTSPTLPVDVAPSDSQGAKLVAFTGRSSIGLGLALRLPIFDAGRLRANRRGKTADLDAAVASSNGALIDAMRDVADQSSTQGSVAPQQVQQQQAARAATESAYQIARQRYQSGSSTLLNVLTTETAGLNQRQLAQALDHRVALRRALGSGLPAELSGASKNIADNDGGTSAGGLSDEKKAMLAGARSLRH